MNSKDKISYLILGLILILGIWVIYPSLFSLLPDFAVEDEMVVVQAFYRAFARDFSNYSFFKYPGLLYLLLFPGYYLVYLIFNFHSLIHLKALEDLKIFLARPWLSEAGAVLLGRCLSLFLGLLSVWLFFEIFKNRAGKKVSLIGALVIISSPSWLFCSSLLKNDTLLIFCLLFTLWASFGILEKGERKYYLLSGLGTGLCISAKLNFFSLILPLSAHWLRLRGERKFIKIFGDKNLIIGMFLALGIFVLTNPFQTFQVSRAIEGMKLELALMRGAQNILQASSQLWHHSPFFFQFLCTLPLAMGILGFIMGLLGIIFLFRQFSRQEFYLFISYPLFYFLSWMIFSRQGYPHYYLPLVIFLALGVGGFFKWLSLKARWTEMIGILLIFISVFFNFNLARELNQAESKIVKESFEWLARHLPKKEELVIFFPYRPLRESDYLLRYKFYPQFFLRPDWLKQTRPKNLLLQEFYYFAFLNNPEARNPSFEGFIYLQEPDSGYHLTRRWQKRLFWAKIYQYAFPDLRHISIGLYQLTSLPSP